VRCSQFAARRSSEGNFTSTVPIAASYRSRGSLSCVIVCPSLSPDNPTSPTAGAAVFRRSLFAENGRPRRLTNSRSVFLLPTVMASEHLRCWPETAPLGHFAAAATLCRTPTVFCEKSTSLTRSARTSPMRRPRIDVTAKMLQFGPDLHAGQYRGQVGLVYIELKHNPGEYDREVFLVLKEFGLLSVRAATWRRPHFPGWIKLSS
jgi:hypothetical protein